MHQSAAFDPADRAVARASGRPHAGPRCSATSWSRLGEQRDDVVAITAAMCDPTGLSEFADRFPERTYDVGIAEQHAVTSAAGLAMRRAAPGRRDLRDLPEPRLRPAAAWTSRCTACRSPSCSTAPASPATTARATTACGISRILGMVPGHPRRRAARRADPARGSCARRSRIGDGPTVRALPEDPARRRPSRRCAGSAASTCWPSPTPDAPTSTCCVVAVGATARGGARGRRHRCGAPGSRCASSTPRWVTPVDPALADLAAGARLVVTVEDGVVAGGVGLAGRPVAAPTRASTCRHGEIGIPAQFPAARQSVADVQGAGRADRSGHRPAHRRVVGIVSP